MFLNATLSILAAVVPTIFYVILLWRLDRYEKEPLLLFAAAFGWGAVPAVLASLVTELSATDPLLHVLGQWSAFMELGVVAPLIEEAFKSAALLGLFWLFRSEFDGILDGIIYGSVIGFGFAMTENLLYFINSWPVSGWANWASLVMVRVGAFGLNHAMYTALAGAALGCARLRKRPGQRFVIYMLGFTAAVAAHMLHNILVAGLQVCMLGLILDWLGVAMLLITVVLAWRNERDIVKTYLRDEVDLGTISIAGYERLLRSIKVKVVNAVTAARPVNSKAWRNYQQTATELAFKKYELAKVGDESGTSQLIVRLRNKLAAFNSQADPGEAAR